MIVYSTVTAGWGYVAGMGLAHLIRPLYGNFYFKIPYTNIDISSYNFHGIVVALLVFLFSIFCWRRALELRFNFKLTFGRFHMKSWKKTLVKSELTKLAEDLSTLHQYLKDKSNEADHYRTIAEVLEAEAKAKSGNGVKTLAHLQKAGDWATQNFEEIKKNQQELQGGALDLVFEEINKQDQNNLSRRQRWKKHTENIVLKKLGEDLTKLKEILETKAVEPDHYWAIAVVLEAQAKAKSGKGDETQKHLERSGKWVSKEFKNIFKIN